MRVGALNWTAIVPLKGGAERKTRLSASLSAQERFTLSERMAAHVLATLADAGVAPRLLSATARPETAWEADRGRGLNMELDRVFATLPRPLLVIHADLPLLSADDVHALIAAAEARGAAIAPDRAGLGTNAIALLSRPAFAFAFGAGSFASHVAVLPGAAIVCRTGLALDVDTPEDLAAMSFLPQGAGS